MPAVLVSLEPGERLETRTRPSRRPRWRAYVPGVSLAVVGIVVASAPSAAIDPVMGLGLTELGATLVVASALLLVATLVAGLLGRPPLLTLVVGATALSLGANALDGAWRSAPLVVAGAGWLALLELQRFTNGLALTNQRVVLPRIARRALAIAYDDVRIVHTTANGEPVGSLILETAHGTLAAPDLPGARHLKDRIEARMRAVRVEPEPTSMAEARGRIERVLAAAPRPSRGRA